MDGDVNLRKKDLKKIPLTFNKVSGSFDCSDNKLTSLKGCPKIVGERFNCRNNLLTSLEYGPESVDGAYDCSINKIKTLDHIAKYVGNGTIDICHNEIESIDILKNIDTGSYLYVFANDNNIKNIPYINFHIELYGNPISSILNPHFYNERGGINYELLDMFFDCEIIRGDKFSLYRFNEFLLDIEKGEVSKIQLDEIKKYYTII